MPALSKQRAEIERQFDHLVADAHKQYLASADDDQRDFLDPPITSANGLLQRVREQNEAFDNFRNKERKLLDVVGEILKPVEGIGALVAGGAGEVFAPTQHIYAAVTFLIGAAQDISEFYDAILDLFTQLQDFTIRLQFYLQEEMSPQLRDKVVQILAALFEILLIATEEINRGRVKSYFRRVFARDSKIPGAVHKLQLLTKGEEGLVMAETLASIKRALSLQHHLAEEVESLRAETRERTALSNRQKLKEILEPSVYAEDRYKYLDKHRTPGTGDWIVEDAAFKNWITGEFQFLWICGNPGTGKSFLTSRLISWGNQFLSGPGEPSPDSLAYFFFRENNPETRSVLQAIRDIGYQLSEDDAFYSKQLLRNLGSKDDIKTISSAFRGVLDGPCTTDMRRRRIYILLDGIDEAEPDQMQELFGLLNDLPYQTRSTKVQVALVGRNVMSELVTMMLDQDMLGDQLRTIHITQERVADDVRAFIVDQVRSSWALRRSTPSFKQEIVDLLVKQVDGLFILAQLMIQDINRKTHPRTIRESLSGYPKEINGMLHTTLKRLSSNLSEAHAADLNETLRWVTCAEQTLTLEQVETVLALEFGDKPLNLEETLRTQFSCFFTLDRDDGLTTADLYQRYEDQRRNLSPGPGGSDSRSNSQSRSQSQSQSQSRSRSRDAARDSPEMFSPLPGVDFSSNAKTTTVTFYHASITEFFRDDSSTNVRSATGGPAIGFDLSEGRLHVLKQCLSVLLKPQKIDVKPIWKYATWYWQEHLVTVDLGKVSVAEKQEIGRSLHMLLTQPRHILDWTKEEETLKLFTDANMACLRKWMSDPDVLGGLDGEARAWAAKAATEPAGLVEPIGRLYAKAWLDPSFGQYIMTMTCFEIVHSVAYIQAGHSWSDSDSQWAGIPARTRMRTALEWANVPKSAHWSRRVGSTLVNLGLQSEALGHFNDALPLDRNIVETCGRIAYCYMTTHQYEKALIRNLMCECLEERLIATGRFTTEREKDYSRWRLYTNQLQIAKCYRRLGEIDKCLDYYEKAMANSYDPSGFEPEEAYLSALAANNRHSQIMELLYRMDRRRGKTEVGRRLVDFLVDQAADATTLEWMIPKTACIKGKTATEFMTKRYHEAIELATQMQDTARQLYLRLSLASLEYFSRDYKAAIAIHQDISKTGSQRGSVLVRTLHTLSLRGLALVYKQMVSSVGVHSPDADALIGKLKELRDYQRRHRHKDMPQRLVGMDVNDASLYLGLFEQQRGNAAEAHLLLSPIILESLAILQDGEPQNDSHAVENLSRSLVAIGDMENAQALFQSMRRPADEILESETLAESAVEGGSHEFAPLLPYVLAHPWVCLQCLNTLMIEDDVVVCMCCLETFCASCLKNVIQGVGNTTKDRRAYIVCRSDHSWFLVPPLRYKLGRGEILVAGGYTMKLSAWEDGVRAKWATNAHTQRWRH